MKQYFQKVLLVSGSIVCTFGITYFAFLHIPLFRNLVNNSQVNQQMDTSINKGLDAGDKIGSLLAGLTAVIAVGYSIWEYKQQSKQQQASEIRQVLRSIAKDSIELFNKLEYGDCLTVAASTITKELKSRLSESPTSDEIKNYLQDKILMKSVATVGWYSSPLTLKCEEFINHLKQNLINLNGDLCIIAEAVKLYTKIIKYKCSPEMFTNTLLSKANSLDINEKNITKILNILNNDLQQCSIYECVHKYNDELKYINDFISNLSYALIDLDDKMLLKVSKTKSVKESEMGNDNNEDKTINNSAENETVLARTIREIKSHANSLEEHLQKISDSHKDLDEDFGVKLSKLIEVSQIIKTSVNKEVDNDDLLRKASPGQSNVNLTAYAPRANASKY